jgi:hypothetical protein
MEIREERMDANMRRIKEKVSGWVDYRTGDLSLRALKRQEITPMSLVITQLGWVNKKLSLVITQLGWVNKKLNQAIPQLRRANKKLSRVITQLSVAPKRLLNDFLDLGRSVLGFALSILEHFSQRFGIRRTNLSQPLGRLRKLALQERGDVPGWVLVVLMTTGLVTAIWSIAAPKLNMILKNSLDSMGNIR